MNLSHACSVHSSGRVAETPVVFVVDPDPAVGDALDALIRSAGCKPRALASAEEFLEAPRTLTASCLLLELDLPGLSGLDLQRLVADRPQMPVIFMSRRADIQATVRAMKGGAFEFLIKPCPPEVLIDAVCGAIERSHAALRHQAQMLALQTRYDSLSRREREVMRLLVCGRLNKQVGGELGISEITVKAHRGKMMRKMQASSFAELVTMATTLRQATLALQ
ncbi:MAG TPA: LuxR C-terminal-related transcriptional regulator [Steroidobacteraceae bacterium]|nr:LuxR C-terminal-related transcriptional regulator [Steroidobacteraceae bacterium]